MPKGVGGSWEMLLMIFSKSRRGIATSKRQNSHLEEEKQRKEKKRRKKRGNKRETVLHSRQELRND
jgi:hypothetical protein